MFSTETLLNNSIEDGLSLMECALRPLGEAGQLPHNCYLITKWVVMQTAELQWCTAL